MPLFLVIEAGRHKGPYLVEDGRARQKDARHEGDVHPGEESLGQRRVLGVGAGRQHGQQRMDEDIENGVHHGPADAEADAHGDAAAHEAAAQLGEMIHEAHGLAAFGLGGVGRGRRRAEGRAGRGCARVGGVGERTGRGGRPVWRGARPGLRVRPPFGAGKGRLEGCRFLNLISFFSRMKIMKTTNWIIAFIATNLYLLSFINRISIINSQVHDCFMSTIMTDCFHLFYFISKNQ